MGFQREFWVENYEMRLEEMSQILAVTDRQFEGTIAKGKTVTMNTYDTASPIRDYVEGVELISDNLKPGFKELSITESKYFNFNVQDIDKVQSNSNMAGIFLNNQVQDMEKAIDAFIISKSVAIVSNIVDKSTVILDPMNVVSVFNELRTKLNKANVSKTGRFVYVDHDTNAVITLAQEQKIVPTSSNKKIGDTEVANICGFDIIVSNAVLPVAGVITLVAGVKNDTFKFAGQITEIESYRSHKQFADEVRGLYTFGADIFTEKKGAKLLVSAY